MIKTQVDELIKYGIQTGYESSPFHVLIIIPLVIAILLYKLIKEIGCRWHLKH